MPLDSGTYDMSPASGKLILKTGRTGMGARAGHDLTIRVGDWRGTVTVDAESPANSSVAVTLDVESFEILQGTGGIKPLTDSDRADIKRTIREKVLHTAKHPTITFQSTAVVGSPDAFSITGDLGIRGAARPVTLRCSVADDGRITGRAVVKQTDWGIKPYSAFLGALKLRDEVDVEFDIGPLHMVA